MLGRSLDVRVKIVLMLAVVGNQLLWHLVSPTDCRLYATFMTGYSVSAHLCHGSVTVVVACTIYYDHRRMVTGDID